MKHTNSKIHTRAALLCRIVVLILLLGAVPFSAPTVGAASSPPVELASTAVPDGLTGEEWTSLQAMMAAADYQLTWQTRDGMEAYRAPNRAQGFDVVFAQDGFTALGYEDGEPAWQFGLSLAAYGDTAMSAAIPRENLTAHRTTVTYQWDERVSEWFHNTPEGVEHGLTLGAPPLGQQGDEIRLAFEVDTDLVPSLSADGQALTLRAPAQGSWEHGPTILRYDALLVTDATGRALPAHLQLESSNLQPPTSNLQLIIDATNATYPLTVDPLLYSQTAILHASDAQAGDLFGWAVSISGDTLVVGAVWEDSGGTRAGAAYVFERNQGGTPDNWGEVTKLLASDAQTDDWFGYAVSISGDTLVVGAPLEYSGGMDAGAAYVFARNQGGSDNWGEVTKLTASDAEVGDNFGYAVSIGGDTLVVGARDQDSGGTNAGAAYVFARNQGGSDAWGQVAKLLASDAQTDDGFGQSVSISGDTLVVGAPYEDSGGADAGAAYVYARNQGGMDAWGQLTKLLAADAEAGDEFGCAVSISGDTLVVGALLEDSGGLDAGAAYVYGRNQGGSDNWGEVTKLLAADAQANEWFGASLSLSGDTLVVGAPNEDSGGTSAGAAYVFERNQGGSENWGEVAKLLAADAQVGDYFGISVSLSGDTLVVGAYGEDSGGSSAGAAYTFTGSGDWEEIASPRASDAEADDRFGWSVSISGDTLVVGVPLEDSGGTNAGAAYVFARNQAGGDNWGQVTKVLASDAQAGDIFGWSVSISGDTLVVGAYGEDSGGTDAGAAYVFERNQGGGDNWGQVTKLTASDAQAGDYFGYAVSISGDTLVVGAFWEDEGGSNAGAAYVFARNQGGSDAWGAVAKLLAADAQTNDEFGIAVGISGDTLVVGARGEDSGGNVAGAAYVFGRNQGGVDNWGPVAKLTALDAQEGDWFGWSVSISGDTLVVGAWYEDSGGTQAGAAYVFERNRGGSDAWGQVAKLLASDAQAGDIFGNAVSISGDTLVVGAPYEDSGGVDAGAAYVFERNQGGSDTWGQVAKLLASDAQAGDHFGYAVSISGDTLVAGAPWEDSGGSDAGAAYVFRRRANYPPLAEDDAFSVAEDSSSNPLDVLANDSDPIDGDPLAVFAVGTPDQGGSVVNNGSDVDYSPALDFYGSETFTYTISDGNGGLDTATVVVTVTNVNDPPDALDDAFTASEDSAGNALDLLANDSYLPDPPETLTISAVGTPDQGGSVVNNGSDVDYSPALDFYGTESFTYTMSDGNGGLDTATVVVTVTNVNDPPDAFDDAFTASEDSAGNALDLLANDTFLPDPPETLTITAVGPPDQGGTVLNAGSHVTYTPALHFFGGETFTYTISDGNGGLDTATVVVTVTNVNDPPDALDDGYTVSEDSPANALDLLSNDTYLPDPPETLTISAVGTPDQGGTVLNNGTDVDYTPALDFFGTETFTYTIADGNGGFDTATVVVTVTNVNDPPDALDDAFTASEDSVSNTLDLLANDTFLPDPPETLTITAVGPPDQGGTVLNAGSHVTYTPALHFFGSETFTYTISDGNGGLDTATVVVTVTSVNDPPVALDDGYTVTEDSISNALDVLVNDSDPVEGDPLSVFAVGPPDQGGTVLNAGTHVTYTSALDFYGSETFTYTISDGNGGYDTATVVVTVTNTNDPPDALDDGYTVPEDSADNALDLLSNDTYLPDPPETLTISAVGPPDQGGSVLNAGTHVTYTPALDFYGSEAFTYTISDGNGGLDTATVVVTVTSVNDPPNALDDGYTVPEDSPDNALDLLVNDSDPVEGDPLSVFAVGTPDQGGTVFNAGSYVTYTPALDFYGSETFTYTMSDGNGGFDTATVVVTLTNTNDPPDALDDGYTVPEDRADNALDLLSNDTYLPDPPETLTISAVGTPDQGGTVLNNGTDVDYTPALDFYGSETFTYTISDGNGGFDTTTVVVTVTNVNDPPDALDDGYTVPEDSPDNALDVLANDSDPVEGDPLSVFAVGTPDQGGTVLNAGSHVTYTPALDFYGSETFTYTISDGNGGLDTATVVVTLTNTNDPPDAFDDDYTASEDSIDNALDVLVNDDYLPDPPEVLTISAVGTPDQGGTVLNASTHVTYTPTLDFYGSETFTYTISDGNGGLDTATVVITVTSVNDAPVAADDAYTTSFETILLIAAPGVLANDSDPVEGDPLTAVLDAGPPTGTLLLDLDGSLVYTPALGFNGLVTFSYYAGDGMDASNLATVTIEVLPPAVVEYTIYLPLVFKGY